MTPSLSGHITIFGLVFFVLKFLLGIATGITSKEEVKGDWLIFLFLWKRIHTMNIPCHKAKSKNKNNQKK